MPGRRPSDGTRTYLVEHYWPGATPAVYEDAMARVASSVRAMAAGGARIRFLHSTFVPHDEAALAVLVADTESRVQEAYRVAGVTCDRVIEAVDSEVPPRQPGRRQAKPTTRHPR
jgi:hypothetical protein